MKFFSGFGFCNEKELFDDYLVKNDFCVAGFSHGAQRALAFALQTQTRVDRLILLSPAFFNDKSQSFKKMQLRYYNSNNKEYMSSFIKNVIFPHSQDVSEYLCQTSPQELEELLNFEWKSDDLQRVQEKNITLEVFLGSDDKIIDSKKANDFFLQFGTTYLIKNRGHIL